MNCLVTGGAGFIGSHLVNRLLNQNNQITIIDNFSTGKKENLPSEKIRLIKADIYENLDTTFGNSKFDVVFHLAAIPRVRLSISDPESTHKTNVDGTFNLLIACKKFGVKKFIFSSSSSVYGDQKILPLTEEMIPHPSSPYGLHKLIGEFYCRLFHELYGLETISLRYFNVYGPRQNPDSNYANLIPFFFKKLKKNESPTIYGDGKNTRDYTFVDDVVRANILASKCKDKNCFGQVFNIGGGKNYSVNDVANIISKLTRAKVQPIHGPAVIEPKNTLANTAKAKKMLGWEPKIKFDEGMQITFRSLQKS